MTVEGGWLAAFSPTCAMWSPLPERHQAPLDPLSRLCGLPTSCGWGHSSFYIRCWPVHSKSSTSDPTASFLPVPTAGQADLRLQHHRDVADGKEGIDGYPILLSAAPWLAGEGGSPCAWALQRWLLLLRPLFQAGAPSNRRPKAGPLGSSWFSPQLVTHGHMLAAWAPCLAAGGGICNLSCQIPPPRQPSGSQHR